MTTQGFAFGLFLLLLLLCGVVNHAQMTQAVDACSVCSCSGTTVGCAGLSLTAIPTGIPINTQLLFLHENNITGIPASAFTGLTALTILHLYNNKITSIPAVALADLTSLTILSLFGNQMTSVSANTFTGLTALTDLDLSNSQITSISASAFAGLTALTQLYLQANQITSIATSGFTDLTALKILYLNGNQITRIPANTFTGLTALSILYLHANQIVDISANTFASLTALTSLYLNQNLLTGISASAFTGLTALNFLYLHLNHVVDISANTFAGLTALTRVALNDNPLTTLPPGLFKGLPNGLALSLSNLYLAPNNFTFGNTVAPPSTYGTVSAPNKCDTACATCFAAGSSSCCPNNCLFCTSSSLCTQCYDGFLMISGSCVPLACGTGGVCICSGTTVNCGSKSLPTIPSGIPVNTTILFLNTNQITSIPADSFTGLTALTQLWLNQNQIASISANAFTGLPALTLLHLGQSQITSIPVSALTSLTALTQLHLFSNQITSISANAFIGLSALTYLRLDANQITSIPADAFTGLTMLTVLNLFNNQITSISASLTDLSLLAQLALHSNQISSLSANTFTGLTALTYLTLNDNPFTTLPPGLFKGLQNALSLSYSFPYLSPNNLTFGENTLAPPSTYGSASQPYKCDTACATCYAAGSGACCATNCLTCTSTNPCTQCYDDYVMMVGYCLASAATNASIASIVSALAASGATASTASAQSALSASFASFASASAASAASASIASLVSATSALSASTASTASASAASVASSIAQNGSGGGSQDSSSSPAAAIAAAVASVAVIAMLAIVFIVLRRRRSQRRSVARPKDSAGPIYQEAVEMTISPLPRAIGSHKDEDIAAYAAVGQKQPEPVYQAISTTSTSPEVVYDYASAYVAGSNSRRIREGLTIVKHLASGNFGDVSLGQVPSNVLPPRAQALLGPTVSESVQVAVKSLKSDADEKSRKDFESEAKLMAPFVHPNVVRLLAALVESEPHLVLLEFVQYGDLRTLLQKSKKQSFEWTQNEQIHAIRQIALGMEYLGTLHFVHRDLAARNCLVGQGMVVKIADFGLSRELADENDYYRMQTRGKLPVKWMAPETLNFRKFSTMSDVWSFGVTAWECSSYGARPYGEMNGMDTLAHVQAGGRLPQPESCMPELYNMMMSCWNITPEYRPSFSQLVKAMKSIDGGTSSREIGAML